MTCYIATYNEQSDRENLLKYVLSQEEKTRKLKLHKDCHWVREYQKSTFLLGIGIYYQIPRNLIYRRSKMPSSILHIWFWTIRARSGRKMELHPASAYHANDIRNFQVFLQFPDQMHPLHWPKVSINILFKIISCR